MAASIASRGFRYARAGPISSVVSLEAFTLAPKPGEAVLSVLQAPLHRTDAAIINGSALGRTNTENAPARGALAPFPRVGGSDGVAKVVSSGGAAGLAAGDTVWVAPFHGTWAETIAVPASHLVKIDPAHAKLAGFAASLVTAHRLVTASGAFLSKGDVILQNGGSSLTSAAVSALAASKGFRVITAATPGPRFAAAAERHKKAGAEVVEYTSSGARQARSLVGAPSRARLFLNGVGGRPVNDFLKLLSDNSAVQCVTYGAQNGRGLLLAGTQFVYKDLTMGGFFLPAFLRGLTPEARSALVNDVLASFAALKFEYPTIVVQGLDKLPAAWDSAFVTGGRKTFVVPK